MTPRSQAAIGLACGALVGLTFGLQQHGVEGLSAIWTEPNGWAYFVGVMTPTAIIGAAVGYFSFRRSKRPR